MKLPAYVLEACEVVMAYSDERKIEARYREFHNLRDPDADELDEFIQAVRAAAERLKKEMA